MGDCGIVAANIMAAVERPSPVLAGFSMMDYVG